MATPTKKVKVQKPTDPHDSGADIVDGTKEPQVIQQQGDTTPMTTQAFLQNKKTEMDNSIFRQRFKSLWLEVQENLVNTSPAQSATSLANTARWTFATTYTNGNMNVFPMLRNDANENMTKVPNAKEPVAFTKILIAAAALGSNIPDATFEAQNKVYARCSYELWRRTWENPFANGKVTLQNVFQNVFTYGWGAWRVYPREVTKPKGKTKKIVFNDMYRESMDCSRTWLGASVNNFDGFARGEAYYEKDVPKADFFTMYPDAKEDDVCYFSRTQESKDAKPNDRDLVTIQYYENELTNRYIVASGSYTITDGQMPNDDTFGHIEWANCFVRDPNDPYGVGLYELARGNAAMNDYISMMTAIEIESEIYPLLFGNNVGNGEMKYRRGPFVVNPKMSGTTIEQIKTSGNVEGGVSFADRQKQIIAQNTGVNDILAGQPQGNNTLGATVILKEAALQRLTLPRNSVVRALERDAYKTISWIFQIYPVEKVEMFDTENEFTEFLNANPGLFVTRKDKKKRDGTKKIVALHSPKISVGFDFNGQKLIDRTSSPIQISRSSLMEQLKKSDNISDILLIQVDGDSMLLPSQEINKQQTLELYSLVTTSTIQIFNALQSNPSLARALFTELLQVLRVYKENPAKWIPKDLMDQLEHASNQPVQAPQGPANKPPSETINFKDVPPPMQQKMAEQAGLSSPEQEQPPTPQELGTLGGGAAGVTAPIIPPQQGQIAAPANPLRRELGLKKQNQGARPSNSMRDAVNASVGRGAKAGARKSAIKK